MVWIDRAAVLFRLVGVVGAFAGIALYRKHRNPWAIVAAVACAIGAIVPFYWDMVPGMLKSWLYPNTKNGIIVSFFLNIGPWIYLLPRVLPEPRPAKRKQH